MKENKSYNRNHFEMLSLKEMNELVPNNHYTDFRDEKVLKFKEFIVMEEHIFDDDDDDDQSSEVIEFLYKLNNIDIKILVNSFIKESNRKLMSEYIEDIMNILTKDFKSLGKEKFDWVETNLKKRIN